jgi:hypothetical protein
MPKKPKAAPKDYYDMKDSVDKSKKIKHSEVFGKGTGKKTDKKTKKNNTKKKSSY